MIEEFARVVVLRRNPVAQRSLASDRWRALLRQREEDWSTFRRVRDDTVSLLAGIIGADSESPKGERSRQLLSIVRKLRRSRTSALNAYHQYRATEHGSMFAAWDVVVAALGRLEDEIARTGSHELRQERTALRDVLRRECVQMHVSLRSPDLFDGLTRLLGEQPEDGSEGVPKDERHFLDLAYRAMHRTSPLGRMTAVHIGLAAEDGRGASPSSPSSVLSSAPLAASARVYADIASRSIYASSDHRPSSDLALNPSLRVVADTLVFVRSAAAGTAQRVRIPVTPELDRVLQLVHHVGLTHAELVEELATRSGDEDAAAASAFVQSMIRERILVPSLAGPRAFGENRLETFPASELDASIQDLAMRSPRERRARVEGIASDARLRLARAGVVTEPVLYEDLGGVTRFGSVEPLREAITPGLRLLAGFDTNVDLALISTDVFQRMHGNSTQKLIDCGAELNREARLAYERFLERPSVDAAEELGLPRFARLIRSRDEVRVALAALRGDPSLDVDIRPDALASLVGTLEDGSPWRSRRAYSVFAQGQDGDWVVNDALGGGGALWARYLPVEDASGAGSELWDYLRAEVGSRERDSVQDMSLHGVSISNSPLISPRPARWEDWQGITMDLDPGPEGLLRFASGFADRDVPDYLGAGAPWLLGPFMGLLHWHRAGGRLDAAKLSTPGDGPDGGSAARGRLRMDGIIFQRRSWSVVDLGARLGNVMNRPFAEVFDFWIDEGLPLQGFFKHREGGRGAKRAKPVYFDATSVASMETLGRRLGDLRRYGIVQEAFPVPVDGEHAMEIMMNTRV